LAVHITMPTPDTYQPGRLPGSLMIPHLEGGFPLRCFQQLSVPNLATGQCRWRDNP